MLHSQCTKCQGFQVLDTYFSPVDVQYIPQLRCAMCGKIEQLTIKDGQWTRFTPEPLKVDGRTARYNKFFVTGEKR